MLFIVNNHSHVWHKTSITPTFRKLRQGYCLDYKTRWCLKIENLKRILKFKKIKKNLGSYQLTLATPVCEP